MLKIEKFDKIIIANWKLNGSSSFLKNYLNNINFDKNRDSHKCVIICPPAVYLKDFYSNNNIKFF